MSDKKRNPAELNPIDGEPDLLSPKIAQLISERRQPPPSKKSTRVVMRAARRKLEKRETRKRNWLTTIRTQPFRQWALAGTASLALIIIIWKLIIPSTVPETRVEFVKSSEVSRELKEDPLDGRLSIALVRARELNINCRGSAEPSDKLSSGVSRCLDLLRVKTERLRDELANADQYPDFFGSDVLVIPGKGSRTGIKWKEV